MKLPSNTVGTRCCASVAPAPVPAVCNRRPWLPAFLSPARIRTRPTAIANRRHGQRGSATILVLALVAILFVYLNRNQLTLHSVKRELRLVEEKQLKKFQAPPKSAQP